MASIFAGVEIFQEENIIPICSATLQFLCVWLQSIKSRDDSARVWEIVSVNYFTYPDKTEIRAFGIRVIFKELLKPGNIATHMGMTFSGKIQSDNIVVLSSNVNSIINIG